MAGDPDDGDDEDGADRIIFAGRRRSSTLHRREGRPHAGRAGERRAGRCSVAQVGHLGRRRRERLREHKAVLDAIGGKATYIGPIGSATVAKLVHNMSGCALACALAETFSMGVKAGLEPLALWQAVRRGIVGRRLTFDAVVDQFLPGRYEPAAFSLKLAHKDVTLAVALGRELGVPMPICDLAVAEMTEALARGWGGRDSRIVMLLAQERAGVKIAVDADRLNKTLASAVAEDDVKPADAVGRGET